jgi:hypothetical protein
LVTTESLQAHIDDKSNPHKVTLKQLGVTASASVLNNLDGRVNDVANQISDMLSMAE